jgi:D-alanyl-D-alanine endopeptidase (penicillin-binding protein 7)
MAFLGSAVLCGSMLGMALYHNLLASGSATAPASAQAALHVSEAPTAPAPPMQNSAASTRNLRASALEAIVPQSGKFIAADLTHMQVDLYQDGIRVAQYPILTKGRPGSPYETPAGQYAVLTKEPDHLNRSAGVHMPYSMQFYGNYFVHGWPYYTDGHPVAKEYSGGCIRLSSEDAEKVYAFADLKTPLYVYEQPAQIKDVPLALVPTPAPAVSAASFLVADLDTGDVYLDADAGTPRPIASLTKLMTALVANETIMFDRAVGLPAGHLLITPSAPPMVVAGSPSTTTPESFIVGDLLYPLLMASNNSVADDLAAYYGTPGFMRWMNSTALSLGMTATHYADPSGISADNISTVDDLYRLAKYVADKKSFIWKIARTPEKTLASETGDAFQFANFNVFAGDPQFLGGKTGQTAAAGETMLSVWSLPIEGTERRIAIVVLHSDDYTHDTAALRDWVIAAAASSQPACVNCALPHPYRKIR